MTTTAFDDQFTSEPEQVRQTYSTADILRRNVADLEIALRKQTERAEKAEAELAKLREREAKQKPVAMVDAGDDGYFAEILPDRSVSVGDMLYAFPPLNIDPELWKPSFDQWWEANGQYLRAGGGQYEKTFGYHAWEAAAAIYAAPVPAEPKKHHEFASAMLDAQPFITAETYGGRYIVAMRFERLGKMQDCHAALLALLQSAEV